MLTDTQHAILDALLNEGPMTPPEIAVAIGYSERTIHAHRGRYLLPLIDAGEAHISEWRRQEGHGGMPMPVYKFGPGNSKPRPPRKKVAERCRNWRNKTRPIRQPERSIISLMLGARSAPKKRKEK